MTLPLPPAPDARALSRAAGAVYLLLIACGLGAELGVRAALVVPGDAVETAARIMARPGLLRAGIGLDIAMLLADGALAVLLFVLFRPASLGLAATATAFRVVQAAVLAGGLVQVQGALLVLTGAPGAALGDGVRAELAMLLLEMHAHGYDLGLIFFAVTCAATGSLVIRSGWFPRALGWLLWAAAAVYMAGSLMRFLAPEQLGLVQPFYAICILAELGLALVLLRGPRPASA